MVVPLQPVSYYKLSLSAGEWVMMKTDKNIVLPKECGVI
jgi:hypothetical protein